MPPSRRSGDPARRRWRALVRDDGSASLEFLGAGVLLLVPVLYLIVALSAIQSGAFAVEGAARQAARVVATATDEADAREGAAAAIEVTLADYGVDDRPDVRISCSPRPDACLTRDGSITVTVGASVPLPLAPAAFGSGPAAVQVQATATQPVSRFRSAVRP